MRILPDMDAIRLEDGSIITAQQIMAAAPHRHEPLNEIGVLDSGVVQFIWKSHVVPGSVLMTTAAAELDRITRADLYRRMRAAMYDESDGRHPKYDAAVEPEPTPPRQRQFPTHQGYDHLVAMRQLEDD